MFSLKSIFVRSWRVAALFSIITLSQATLAQEILYAYGPGGPAPAMKEAAAVFEKTSGIKVEVTAGPTLKWLDKAKTDADRKTAFDKINTIWKDEMPSVVYSNTPEVIASNKKVKGLKYNVATTVMFDKAWIDS